MNLDAVICVMAEALKFPEPLHGRNTGVTYQANSAIYKQGFRVSWEPHCEKRISDRSTLFQKGHPCNKSFGNINHAHNILKVENC